MNFFSLLVLQYYDVFSMAKAAAFAVVDAMCIYCFLFGMCSFTYSCMCAFVCMCWRLNYNKNFEMRLIQMSFKWDCFFTLFVALSLDVSLFMSHYYYWLNWNPVLSLLGFALKCKFQICFDWRSNKQCTLKHTDWHIHTQHAVHGKQYCFLGRKR